jgi:hypothetical protein
MGWLPVATLGGRAGKTRIPPEAIGTELNATKGTAGA